MLLFGAAMWCCRVVLLCGVAMWCCCVVLLCGAAVWAEDVGIAEGHCSLSAVLFDSVHVGGQNCGRSIKHV
jgi:hypothetical protein